MKTILGIDEAGRGPVIGPMVMAGVLISEADEKKLKELGVKDSKLLTPKKREELFDKIKKIAKDYEIIIIPPKEIDEAVESQESNLNRLEVIKSAMIINKFNPNLTILDCPTVSTHKYEEEIRFYLKNKELKLKAENKADVNYPVVSAASILAKVTRDREIEKLKEKYGDIGPGYPSNEITKKFIKENWNKHPEIFRKSWATFKNIERKKDQKNLVDF
ncbi:ribonuclease HII [Candidatus Woesearchaeota archaeon]|nr:ribonuclease HII [Candidatus Woesearchaeota archaeon]